LQILGRHNSYFIKISFTSNSIFTVGYFKSIDNFGIFRLLELLQIVVRIIWIIYNSNYIFNIWLAINMEKARLFERILDHIALFRTFSQISIDASVRFDSFNTFFRVQILQYTVFYFDCFMDIFLFLFMVSLPFVVKMTGTISFPFMVPCSMSSGMFSSTGLQNSQLQNYS